MKDNEWATRVVDEAGFREERMRSLGLQSAVWFILVLAEAFLAIWAFSKQGEVLGFSTGIIGGLAGLCFAASFVALLGARAEARLLLVLDRLADRSGGTK